MPGAAVSLRNSYNEQVRYDANGNITALKRNGENDSETTTIEIDDLKYTYKGNRLLQVMDTTNHPKGFKDSSDNNGDDYTYYDNGDLKTDKNKGIITPIKYNHLNLPVEIVFNNNTSTKINYLYNGEGKKLAKTVTNGSSVTVTDYLAGNQYTNGVLDFFPTSEGYVKSTVAGSTTSYNYVFNYKDHLGNVRLSYTLDPADNVVKIMEENHYYPFGLKHNGYSPTQKIFAMSTPPHVVLTPVLNSADATYKYKYNGKELQDELGLNLYDYGARNYDPAIGRWLNIDPLAETSRRFSPYVYALNNPVYFIDPDGMQADASIGYLSAGITQNVAIETTLAIGSGLGIDPPKKNPRKANTTPKGMKHEDALKVVTEIDGQKYKKYTGNIFAEIGNTVNSWFGGDNDYFVEHQKYDKADESFINEAFDQSAGALVGGAAFKIVGKGTGALLSGLGDDVTKAIAQYASQNNIFKAALAKGVNKQILNKYYQQMLNNEFVAVKGAAGFVNNGKYYLTEGTHRMQAAIKYAVEHGDDTYVKQIMANGRFQSSNPVDYGYKLFKITQ